MNINEILKKGIEVLRDNNIEDCTLKARMILSHIINQPKEYIMIHSDEEINEIDEKEFWNKIERLKKNEPIQYILNYQEFMGFNFFVDSNVLIPQPDTEILVEETLLISKKINNKLNILDLCTGSGAIAVALSNLLKDVKVYASDISKEALEIAKRNAEKNNATINFIESDLFEKFANIEKFDIITSNPPYIKTDVINELAEEVKHEPIIALDGGQDGLYFYKKIIKQAKKYLKANGYLVLEIGYDQKNEVIQLLENENYKNIYSKKDLGGNDRIIVGQYI